MGDYNMVDDILDILDSSEKQAFLDMLKIDDNTIPAIKKDSRDISSTLMEEFIVGAFFEFYKFAKDNKKLVICFRGNGNPETVTIYRFNHMVWELYIDTEGNYCVRINYNHARYVSDLLQEDGTLKYIDKLEKIGFKTSEMKVIKNSPKFDYFVCAKQDTYSKDFVEQTYKIIVEDFMKSYYDPRIGDDSFRKIKGLPPVDRKAYPKHPYIEKRWQQSIFNKFQSFSKDGVFVYDLEFSQKFPSDTIKKKLERYINEPDMLGVRFNDGKIVSFLLIEVKSGETACSRSSSSGIPKHLEKMLEYSKFDIIMQNRFADAEKILKRYQVMGKIPSDIEIAVPQDINIERILILTDYKIEEGEYNPPKRSAVAYFDAVNQYYRNRKDNNWILENAKENQSDIWIMSGQYFEDFKVKQIIKHSEIVL